MSDGQSRCQNPSCGLPIEVIPGHRRRKYCNDGCLMAAHRARLAAENQARYEALIMQLSLQEREDWRKVFGDLLPASLDLLRHLRITYGAALAEQVGERLKAERNEGRKTSAEERTTLLSEFMLAGEQIDFPALATELFELQPGVFAWSAFGSSESLEDLRLAREAAYLKLQAKNGRLKLGEHT